MGHKSQLTTTTTTDVTPVDLSPTSSHGEEEFHTLLSSAQVATATYRATVISNRAVVYPPYRRDYHRAPSGPARRMPARAAQPKYDPYEYCQDSFVVPPRPTTSLRTVLAALLAVLIVLLTLCSWRYTPSALHAALACNSGSGGRVTSTGGRWSVRWRLRGASAECRDHMGGRGTGGVSGPGRAVRLSGAGRTVAGVEGGRSGSNVDTALRGYRQGSVDIGLTDGSGFGEGDSQAFDMDGPTGDFTQWTAANVSEQLLDGADRFACHYFQHLDGMDHTAAWELQQPDVKALVDVLRGLQPRHLCTATAAAADAAGAAANATAAVTATVAAASLQPLVAAVAVLRSLSCGDGVEARVGGAAAAARRLNFLGMSSPAPLPVGGFVAVRRLTLAVMLQMWRSAGPGSGWRDALNEVAGGVFVDFHWAHECGAVWRPIMELFHVSKSGGTSVCQLARLGTRVANHFDQDANCLQEHFYDEPKWTHMPDFLPMRSPRAGGRCDMWLAYDCNNWLQTPEITCDARQQLLSDNKLDLFSNEHALHDGTEHPGAAHTCPQFVSLVTMRDPLRRVESHVMEVMAVYQQLGRRCTDASHRSAYNLPSNLTFWSNFAPAVVDNYFVRSLLGKHFHCMPFGGLTDNDLHHAQLKLLTFDHIVVVEDNLSSDVVFRLGLGWPQSLRSMRLRWRRAQAAGQQKGATGVFTQGAQIEAAAGFPPGSSRLLASWNTLDQQLYDFGKVANQLDAAFLATSSVYRGRVRQTLPGRFVLPGVPQTKVLGANAQWDARTGAVRHDNVGAMPLPVDPQLLLFGSTAVLNSTTLRSGSTDRGTGSGAGGVVGRTSNGTRLQYVCPDSSLNGTRPVRSAKKQVAVNDAANMFRARHTVVKVRTRWGFKGRK